LVGALIVEPREAASPAPDREYTLVTQEWVTATPAVDQPAPPTPPASDGMGEMMGQGGMMGSMLGSGAGQPQVDTFTVNGKAYPHVPPLIVRQGERVRLRLINGRPVDGPLKDTLTVRHMEQYEIEFVANNPGTWLFHCHNLVHMSGGLMVEVQYR
jgi:FtsP/CotA-like multicopper oxidase with cupredoxin domain